MLNHALRSFGVGDKKWNAFGFRHRECKTDDGEARSTRSGEKQKLEYTAWKIFYRSDERRAERWVSSGNTRESFPSASLLPAHLVRCRADNLRSRARSSLQRGTYSLIDLSYLSRSSRRSVQRSGKVLSFALCGSLWPPPGFRPYTRVILFTRRFTRRSRRIWRSMGTLILSCWQFEYLKLEYKLPPYDAKTLVKLSH